VKSIKVASAAAVLLVSTSAHAQTSVTIYGIMDACVAVSNNTEGARTQVSSGCGYGSRLGFRGQEDLGGGMKADFTLESGISLDTGALGQGGRLFGRKALVGLIGSYGQLHVGRDYSPTFYLVRPVDPFKLGLGTASSMISTGSRSDGLGRNDNSIVYTSPNLRGFTIKGSYALGESATEESRARDAKGVLVSYTDGKLLAGVGFSSNANALDSGSDKTATVGASYKFKSVEPAFLYQTGKWEGTRTVAAPSIANSFFSRDYASLMVGLTLQPGGVGGRWIATYKRYNDKTVRDFDADQITVGYKYSLSKRTELYTAYSRVSNSDNSAFAVVDANTTYGPVNPGMSPSTFFAGITHVF
jgi:GBP family porin